MYWFYQQLLRPMTSVKSSQLLSMVKRVALLIHSYTPIDASMPQSMEKCLNFTLTFNIHMNRKQPSSTTEIIIIFDIIIWLKIFQSCILASFMKKRTS